MGAYERLLEILTLSAFSNYYALRLFLEGLVRTNPGILNQPLEGIDNATILTFFIEVAHVHPQRIPIIRMLVEAGADINLQAGVRTRPQEFTTPLISALASDVEDRFNLTKAIIDLGADVNQRIIGGETDGLSPLGYALYLGRSDIIKLLLDNAADIDESMSSNYTRELSEYGNYLTPLAYSIMLSLRHSSASEAQRANALFDVLLEKGADVNKQSTIKASNDLHSPINIAVIYGNMRAFNKLIESGAHIDPPITDRPESERNHINNSATYAAIGRTNELGLQMLGVLLDKGADPNIVLYDNEVKTNLLEFALKRRNFSAAKLLLDRGADPNKAPAGVESLLRACIHENKFDMLDLIFEKGARLNSAGYEQQQHDEPAICCVIQSGNIPIDMKLMLIKLFLEKGANINGTMRGNPLATAVRESCKAPKDQRIVDYLLKAGADVNKGAAITGSLPLNEAIESGDLKLVQKLFEHGAKAKLTSDATDGKTSYISPLSCYLSSGNKNPEILTLLLEKGADVNTCEVFGKRIHNPLLIALSRSPDNVALLLKLGAKIDLAIDAIVKLNFDVSDYLINAMYEYGTAYNDPRAIACAIELCKAEKPKPKSKNTVLDIIPPETGEHDITPAKQMLDKIKGVFSSEQKSTIVNTDIDQMLEDLITKLLLNDSETSAEVKKAVKDVMSDIRELSANFTEENKAILMEKIDALRKKLDLTNVYQAAFEWVSTYKYKMMYINTVDYAQTKKLLQEMMLYILSCIDELQTSDNPADKRMAQDLEFALAAQLHNAMSANEGAMSCLPGTPRFLRVVLQAYYDYRFPIAENRFELVQQAAATVISNLFRERLAMVGGERHTERLQKIYAIVDALTSINVENAAAVASGKLLEDGHIKPLQSEEEFSATMSGEPFDAAMLRERCSIFHEKFPNEAFFSQAVADILASQSQEFEFDEQESWYISLIYYAICDDKIKELIMENATSAIDGLFKQKQVDDAIAKQTKEIDALLTAQKYKFNPDLKKAIAAILTTIMQTKFEALDDIILQNEVSKLLMGSAFNSKSAVELIKELEHKYKEASRHETLRYRKKLSPEPGPNPRGV